MLKRLFSAILRGTRLDLWPVRVRGGVAADARWTVYPWSSYWRGTHEPHVQSALTGLGGGDIRGWNCWDLGAHFGLYSVGLARRVGLQGEVAAFEPNPTSFARLQRHCRMNRLSRLKCYAAAASDHADGAELFTYGNLNSTTTHLPYLGETRSDQVQALAVRTIRLDDLVRSGELMLPTFIKIDVEGHGHRALAGMQATVESARPIVLAAFHCQEEIEGMMTVFSALEYTWRNVASAGTQPEIRMGADYLFQPKSGTAAG
jgi:FkbM family methyltransferase